MFCNEFNFSDITVAYFSMEIGINYDIPTYSGGLGVLAGDTLRSFADLNVPAVGITLLYKNGYFYQKIVNNRQIEENVLWDPNEHMLCLPNKIIVKIEGRDIYIQAWLYIIEGPNSKVPVLFLDTDVPENSDFDRTITHNLYAKDDRYRLAQEIVLGIGGVRILDMLGATPQKYHMNEGHSALLTFELCRKLSVDDVIHEVRKKCVFTTHTPVPAGHDKFPRELAENMLGDMITDKIRNDIYHDDKLNMTYIGLRFSRHVNGVAKKHTEISTSMFPEYHIESITNGVHSQFWTCKPIQSVFDKYVKNWRTDAFSLRYSLGIPNAELWNAHMETKNSLIEEINKRTNLNFHSSRFTIGFARRFTAYKRPNLIFNNIERLKAVAEKVGDIQIVFAGKAHPRDTNGKELLNHVINSADNLNSQNCKVKVAFLENYDLDLAKKLVAGCDIWLNNPMRPKEASGTSGMKAAHNGVPHFSVLDGWWLEGHIENITGWSIGPHPNEVGFDQDLSPDDEATDLYNKLENIIVPTFYGNRDLWIKIMKNTISFNASFFNTQRMAQQYVLNSYFI